MITMETSFITLEIINPHSWIMSGLIELHIPPIESETEPKTIQVYNDYKQEKQYSSN